MKRMYALLLLFLLSSLAHAELQCDGIDDQLTLSGITIATNWTIAAWIYPVPSSAANGTILDQNAGDVGLWYRGANFYMRWLDSASDSKATLALITENTWNHVAYVCNAGTIQSYLNGVAVAVINAGTCSGATLTRMCNDSLSELFKGKIGNLITSDAPFTAEEIANLAGARQHYTALSRALTIHWTFDQCPEGTNADGIAFVDRSDGGHTLTANDGANNAGLTCGGSFTYPWGAN